VDHALTLSTMLGKALLLRRDLTIRQLLGGQEKVTFSQVQFAAGRALPAAFDYLRGGVADAVLLLPSRAVVTGTLGAQAMVSRLRGCPTGTAAPGLIARAERSEELV
jgi:hypothetical protein